MPKKNKRCGLLQCDQYIIQNICYYLRTEDICKLSALCKIFEHVKNYVTYVKTFANITPKQIKCFSNLQTLHLENIESTKHTQRKTNGVLACVPNIKKLYCGTGRCYNDKSIMRLHNLVNLDCGDVTGLTDAIFEYLPNLEWLSCGKNKFVMDGIKPLNNLKYLSCDFCEGIYNDSILNMPNLKTLVCGLSNIEDEGLKYVPQLEELYCFDYDSDKYGKFDDDTLDMYRSSITDKGLLYVPKLKVLHCGDSDGITFESLKYLRSLREISCNGNIFTDYDMSIIGDDRKLIYEMKTYLSNIKILWCALHSVCDFDIQYFTNLETLYCGFNERITDESIREFKHLKKLDCGFYDKITDDGILEINDLHELICGNNSTLTNAVLRKHTNITHLNCGNNHNIDFDGILCLKKLEKLELDCDGCLYDDSIKLLSRSVKISVLVNTFVSEIDGYFAMTPEANSKLTKRINKLKKWGFDISISKYSVTPAHMDIWSGNFYIKGWI